MNEDNQPADERLAKPSLHARVIMSAARAWVVWSRTSVEARVEGNEHRYDLIGVVCTRASPWCDGDFAKETFNDVDVDDVPFSSDDQTEGRRWLLGVFPIWHEAEPEELRTSTRRSPGTPFIRRAATPRR